MFCAVFVWMVFTGGRFSAPFLQNVAHFNDTLVGLAMALQFSSSSTMGTMGGAMADKMERRYPRRGRVCVMIFGILLSTAAIIGHGITETVHVIAPFSHQIKTFSHMSMRVLYSIGLACVMPALDGLAIAYLEEEENTGSSSDYGKERLYGAIGWAFASVIIGPLIDEYGFNVFFVSAPIAAIYCLITFKSFIVNKESCDQRENKSSISEMKQKTSTADIDSENAGAYAKLPIHMSTDSRDVSEPISQSSLGKDTNYIDERREGNDNNKITLWTILKVMCGTIYGIGFMFTSTTLRMGTSVVESLIFLFFEKSLGGSNTLCGLTVAVTVMFEIPIFQLSPALLKYFGPGNLQQIASIAYITRVIGYTLIPARHSMLVLFLEPLHGVTYACAKTSLVEFASLQAPKGYEASAQGVLESVVGLGSLIGLSLGGWVEDVLGPKTMYRCFAAVVFVGSFVFYFADGKQTSRLVNKERLPCDSEETQKLVQSHNNRNYSGQSSGKESHCAVRCS